MKKTMRRLLAVTFALVLALSMSLSAFATSTPKENAIKSTATDSSTANILVTSANAGDTLNLYKVIDVKIGLDNELEYSFTTDFQNFITASTNSTVKALTEPAKYIQLSEEDLKTVLGEFTAYVRDTANNVEPVRSRETGDTTDTTFGSVPLGQYIIVGMGNSTGAYIYQTVTAEVVPFAENGEYKVYDEYDVKMKVSKPTGTKEIEAVNGTAVADTEKSSASANIGDSVKFKLSFDVPVYPAGATRTTFFAQDTLDEGLTMPANIADFTVKGFSSAEDTTGTDLTPVNYYTVDLSGNTFTINFVYDKVKTYSKVTVEYSATLNENAVLGTPGNLNDMSYIYSNDPYADGGYDPENPIGWGVVNDVNTDTYVYTFGLAVNKYDINDSTKKLVGAEFKIYNNAECSGAELATLTTNDKGYAVKEGLKAGTYYLKETKAPAGYKLDENVETVTIGNDTLNFGTVTTETVTEYTTDSAQAMVQPAVQAENTNGEYLWLKSGENTPTAFAKDITPAGDYLPAYVKSVTTVSSGNAGENSSATTNGGTVVLDIANTPGTSLPVTGGMGTVLFFVIGGSMMAAALIILIAKKRHAK